MPGGRLGQKAGGRQRTDSTHVLAKIRALNRTLRVAQTMVYALNVLAEVAPEWMKTLPAVTTLHAICEHQFEPFEQGGRWRQEPLLPAAQLLTSPYDLEARNGKKRSTFWTGYKVHLTRICDDDALQLITHVQTTPVPSSDEGDASRSASR